MAEMPPLKPSDRPPTTREYPNDRDAEIAQIEKVEKASGVPVHELPRSRNIRDRLCDEQCCSEAPPHKFPRHRLRRRPDHSHKGVRSICTWPGPAQGHSVRWLVV